MHKNTIVQTSEFSNWVRCLRDDMARTKIFIRTDRLIAGNPGDVKHFDGISEMRIDHGPGYRIYFAQEGRTIYLLLNGGDKSSQAKDIAKARRLLAERVPAPKQRAKIRL